MIAIDAFAAQVSSINVASPNVVAIDVLKWPGVNVAFLVSLTAATIMTLAAIPYGKRRPIGTPFSWGEAMLGATYAFGVLFLAFGVVPHQWIDHADKDLKWSRTRIVYGPGGILKPQIARRLEPDHAPVRGDPRHHRRRHPRLLLRAADLHLDVVAEARPDHDDRDRDQHVRPAIGQEGLTDGPH